MGNRPKPAAVKTATGNPGKRPFQERVLPDTGPVQMPAYLKKNPAAVRLWKEYAPALTTLGTLRKESERLFAVWCSEMALYERDPEAFVASRITQIRTLAASLGMDPSYLGKFITLSEEDHDPAAKFYVGGGPRLAG